MILTGQIKQLQLFWVDKRNPDKVIMSKKDLILIYDYRFLFNSRSSKSDLVIHLWSRATIS